MTESRMEALKSELWQQVWAVDVTDLPRWRLWAVRVARFAHTVVRELASGELNLRAAWLVYFSLLSLVPALAVTFAMLKAFNVHEKLEPALYQLLLPFGDQAGEIAAETVSFLEALDLARLGSLGLAALLVTIVMLVHRIESALNYIFRVPKNRSLIDQVSSYLTVVLLGPLLTFMALGITASVLTSPAVAGFIDGSFAGPLVALGARLAPFLLVTAAFTFVYAYLPNTKVRGRSALFGAAVSGVLWASVGWVFAVLAVGSSRYTAIYSGFALAILFMMWLYLAWLITLVGASFAFYHQNPEYLGLSGRDVPVSNRVRERLSLDACVLIGQHFQRGLAPPTAASLARRMGAPLRSLEGLLRALSDQGLLTATAEDPPAYLPGRALESVPLTELWYGIRSAHERRGLESSEPAIDDAVRELLERMEAASARELQGRAWRDLVVAATDTAHQPADGDEAAGTFVDVTPIRRDRARSGSGPQ